MKAYLVGIRAGLCLAMVIASIATLVIVLNVKSYVTHHDEVARAAIVDFSGVKATIDSIDTRLRRMEQMLAEKDN